MSDLNLDDLKAKAEAATGIIKTLDQQEAIISFMDVATPELVSQLIAEIERFQWIINEADRSIEATIYLADHNNETIQEGDLRDVQHILRDDMRGDL